MPKGINVRHQRSCSLRGGGRRCSCEPSVQAQVWDPRTRKRSSKTFTGPDAEQDAKDWRDDRQREIREGSFRPVRAVTIRQGLTELIEAMEDGVFRNRSGDLYKPSTIRGYDQAVKTYLSPAFGSARVTELQPEDIQRLVTRMIREGHGASTIRNALLPLRVLYRRLKAPVSPVSEVELPAVRGQRMRIATPGEATLLLTALPRRWRALWATAIYAGLRLGELQALRIEHVDLANGIISVEASWDVKAGRVDPKSLAGVRRVPIAGALRDYLVVHIMELGWTEGFVFGAGPERVLQRASLYKDSRLAIAELVAADAAAAEIEERAAAAFERLTPHDCRHTYASLMIAAGVNAKALSTYMGHANISITLDRYGHLMPGNEEEAAELLDAYLERANTAARKAVLDGG